MTVLYVQLITCENQTIILKIFSTDVTACVESINKKQHYPSRWVDCFCDLCILDNQNF